MCSVRSSGAAPFLLEWGLGQVRELIWVKLAVSVGMTQVRLSFCVYFSEFDSSRRLYLSQTRCFDPFYWSLTQVVSYRFSVFHRGPRRQTELSFGLAPLFSPSHRKITLSFRSICLFYTARPKSFSVWAVSKQERDSGIRVSSVFAYL